MNSAKPNPQAHLRPLPTGGAPVPGGRGARRSGFTLTEIMVVLTIVALAAAVIAPSMEPAEPLALERITQELAAAVRHARGEARRMATPYGLFFDVAEGRVRVFRATAGTTPPVPNFDVEHPISKRPYDIELSTDSGIPDLGLTATASYSGTCGTPQILGFDAHGMPRCGDPWEVLLTSVTLTVAVGEHSREVVLHGHTGRVVVQ